MLNNSHIPVLTDLIEAETDINLSEIGLSIGHDPKIQPTPPPAQTNPIDHYPELEQSIRRILDEHVERAWQEIKLAIEAAFHSTTDNNSHT